MCDLVICRICLRTDTKSYHYDQFNLKYYYEQITASKVNDREHLPKWFCFECAALLSKYQGFRQKCYAGQNTLREIAWNGMLSYEAVSKVDRDGRNLQSPLSITQSDDGKTFTNILSPSVPYKKRSNIKVEYISHESTKLTNTFQHLVDAAEKASTSLNDDVDLDDMIDDNMADPRGSDIKTESMSVDMDMINSSTVPISQPEAVIVQEHTYNPHYIEPINFHPNHSIFGQTSIPQQEPEPVWIPTYNETSTSSDRPEHTGEKKVWSGKTSFIEPQESVEKKTSWGSKTTFMEPQESLEKKTSWGSKTTFMEPEESDQKKSNWGSKTSFMEPQESEEKKRESNWASKSSFLDPANWKRTMLTEEQAIEKFHKRAIDPKYVNARYKCAECYSNFAREEMLRKHILINHVENVGSHVCRFCKRRFLKACKLRLHMKRHYVQIECLRCHMLFWGEGLAFQHEEFHRGVTTTCKYCNHQFRHKSTYYQHLRTHHRSSHVCAACGASFVSKAGLNVHKRRLHSLDNKEMSKEPDANIYCKRCDMKFATLAAYQEHYRHSALHADGIDMAISADDLRGINGPNPNMAAPRQPCVRCTVCNEQFYTYQACMKHHRHHHPAVPFMKKSVTYSGKTNERVNCEICGALIKVTSLYTHMNAHTRTKVYTCEVCEMTFNYPTSLLRHRVTHTGEKKYPCPLCEKRFTQRNSMQLHYRTFHLKEPYPKRNRQKKKPPQPVPEVNVTSLMS